MTDAIVPILDYAIRIEPSAIRNGMSALGGLGGVSFMSQFIGTLLGIAIAMLGGLIVYGSVKFAGPVPLVVPIFLDVR